MQKIEQAKDKSVSVTTSVYSAAIDSQGNLTELSVKGLPFATSNFSATPNAREPQPFENVSISVSGIDVVVSAGSARTQFSFEEDTINVISEGYGFELFIEPLGKRVLVQRKDEDEKFLRVD